MSNSDDSWKLCISPWAAYSSVKPVLEPKQNPNICRNYKVRITYSNVNTHHSIVTGFDREIAGKLLNADYVAMMEGKPDVTAEEKEELVQLRSHVQGNFLQVTFYQYTVIWLVINFKSWNLVWLSEYIQFCIKQHFFVKKKYFFTISIILWYFTFKNLFFTILEKYQFCTLLTNPCSP